MTLKSGNGLIGSIILSAIIATASQASGIKGKIIDSDSRQAVPGAVITILDTKFYGVADTSGYFSISNVPPGRYTVSVTCMGYRNSPPEPVNINSSRSMITVNIDLRPTQSTLGEVTVEGEKDNETEISARYMEKIAPSLINVISASTIQTLPDLNVADIMQRVSGVSMQKNNYGSNDQVIIRGMPPRYNSTLVNGVIIPSPSSSGRSVSLDVFGSELVGRIEVMKALTPDVEGDGIGGTVNIIMKQAPDSAFLNAELSSGYNQYYFNHDFLTFDKKSIARKDFWETRGKDYIPAISDFPRQNLVVKSRQAPPDGYGTLSFGKRFFNHKLGVMVAGNFQNIYLANRYNYIDYSTDPNNNLHTNFWENQIYCKNQKRYGGYLNLDYKFNNNNRINFYNSFFQLNETRVREAIDTLNENSRTTPGTGTLRPIRNQTITDDSGIESALLRGFHQVLPELTIDWSLVYSRASSNSPDFATIDYTKTILSAGDVVPFYMNYTRSVVRTWQWDFDEDKSAYLNITYSPRIFGHMFTFKAGGMGRMKFRKNYANDYVFDPTPENGSYPDPDILTVPLTTKNDQQSQGNAVNNPGNYRAWEDIQSGYGMLTTSFGKLQIVTGLRVENTYMKNEHNQNNPQVPVGGARFAYYDPLPSIHFNYRLTPEENLRMSYYAAINRPNYTEVIPYSDVRPGGNTGNPNLQHAKGDCFDIRYEWYPERNSVFTAGLFYKKIHNAIEELINPGTEFKSFQNVPECTNYGMELVGIKYFGKFGVNANYTYTHSAITVPKHYNVTSLDGTVTTITREETRPLVGQSPHLVNVGLNYRDPGLGLEFSIVYSMQGYHVINVNDAYGKDEYLRNYHNLGVSFQKRILRYLTLVAKASNLLSYPIKFYTRDGTFVEKLNTYQGYFLGLRLNI